MYGSPSLPAVIAGVVLGCINTMIKALASKPLLLPNFSFLLRFALDLHGAGVHSGFHAAVSSILRVHFHSVGLLVRLLQTAERVASLGT